MDYMSINIYLCSDHQIVLFRMKRTIITCLLALCVMASFAKSNNLLYLKNGSIIKCNIVEMNPDENIKVQTSDGSLFVFDMFQVEKIEQLLDLEQTQHSKTDSRLIYKKKSYLTFDNGIQIPNVELLTILGDKLYKTYRSAHSQVNKGNNCLFIGLGLTGLTIVTASLSVDFPNLIPISVLSAIGADALICVGCVFRGIGNGRLRAVAHNYNSLPVSNTGTLSLQPSMLLSPQKDLAFGATMKLNF